jgi:hypothetical protein
VTPLASPFEHVPSTQPVPDRFPRYSYGTEDTPQPFGFSSPAPEIDGFPKTTGYAAEYMPVRHMLPNERLGRHLFSDQNPDFPADSGTHDIIALVLRSLNSDLASRDPFHAALGLVLLSRLGFHWDESNGSEKYM